MKKQTFVAMLLVLALLMVQFSLPEAMAATNYDPCMTGNHVMEFLETVEVGPYGQPRYFDVNSCAYASYTHQHYYLTHSMLNTYECVHCGYSETRWVRYDDDEMGQFCTEHDFGK